MVARKPQVGRPNLTLIYGRVFWCDCAAHQGMAALSEKRPFFYTVERPGAVGLMAWQGRVRAAVFRVVLQR